MPNLLQAIAEFSEMCPEFNTLAAGLIEKGTVEEIQNGTEAVNETLFDVYSENLRRAVNSVYSSAGGEIINQFNANVNRFATFKAMHATSEVREADNTDEGRSVLNKYNRWQAAEYNATVARCRTAKQWDKFMEHADVLPNIRWVPSRSVKVREEHTPFYNRIWAKDDPFWSRHQPGNCYGCKCDWVETLEETTEGNPKGKPSASPGLEGNPAMTGEIFGEKHNYFKKASVEQVASVKTFYRKYVRDHWENFSYGVTTNVGHLSIDEISVTEVSKGSSDNKSYFLKMQILENIEDYIDKMVPLDDEEIDLGHNRSSSKYYRRKSHFERMKVWKLNVGDYEFKVKAGQYSNGSLHLYVITG